MTLMRDYNRNRVHARKHMPNTGCTAPVTRRKSKKDFYR
jgi:hypothetical protein